MTTHELETGQTVIVAVVPRTATEFNLDTFTQPALVFKNKGRHEALYISEIATKSAVIIGTIQHPGVCSFDPEPFVESVQLFEKKRWRHYYKGHEECPGFEDWNFTTTANESFLSRLAAWGYYWDNPLGKKPDPKDYWTNVSKTRGRLTSTDWNTYNPALKAWQEAESRKLSVEQMVVVILIKKV